MRDIAKIESFTKRNEAGMSRAASLEKALLDHEAKMKAAAQPRASEPKK